jgi:hypothetical protein
LQVAARVEDNAPFEDDAEAAAMEEARAEAA